MELLAQNDVLRSKVWGSVPLSGQERILYAPAVYYHRNFAAIMLALRDCSDFCPATDPLGDHSCGQVTVNDEVFSFRIEYFDRTLVFPVDPYLEEPFRVLTITRVFPE